MKIFIKIMHKTSNDLKALIIEKRNLIGLKPLLVFELSDRKNIFSNNNTIVQIPVSKNRIVFFNFIFFPRI